jgi:hypothetical protein
LLLLLVQPGVHVSQHLFVPTVMVGAGLGILIVTATSAILAGVPSTDSGLATGLQNTARQLGGSIGIAVLANLAHRPLMGRKAGEIGLAEFRVPFLAMAVPASIAAASSLMLRSEVAER